MGRRCEARTLEPVARRDGFDGGVSPMTVHIQENEIMYCTAR
jgi:hypothetical protein